PRGRTDHLHGPHDGPHPGFVARRLGAAAAASRRGGSRRRPWWTRDGPDDGPGALHAQRRLSAAEKRPGAARLRQAGQQCGRGSPGGDRRVHRSLLSEPAFTGDDAAANRCGPSTLRRYRDGHVKMQRASWYLAVAPLALAISLVWA